MSNCLEHIRTLYVGQLTGEPSFGRQLVHAIQYLRHLDFPRDRRRADAVLTAHGAYDDDGFIGDLALHDPRGTLLWSAHAMRPHGSAGPMAYERLLAQLASALPVQLAPHAA